MNTTFYFSSASEVSEAFLTTIKAAYKEKPISVIVEEDIYVPVWQKEEVMRRATDAHSNPDSLLDFGVVMQELEKELTTYDA
ncbi:MAG: hypothetical protein LBV31_04390 [Prevotellaceae bacterium]|jgi:ribosomal protein S17|nr:hypothetical protein [Prevotellaceae bacterium]